MQCPKGYGRAVVDLVETCVECDIGYYSDTVDNSTCNSCPTDYGITNGRGAMSITNCSGINIYLSFCPKFVCFPESPFCMGFIRGVIFD